LLAAVSLEAADATVAALKAAGYRDTAVVGRFVGKAYRPEGANANPETANEDVMVWLE
jgi:hydrogenase maturation factor